MNNFEEVDLAILGAGCAGLSLARELALRGVKQSVLILEPRQEYEDDRSWCFWSKRKEDLSDELAPLVSHSWPRWAFGLLGKTQESRSCQDVYYHFVRSVDFYKNCLATLEKCASIQLRMGLSVTGLTRHEKGWFVQCSDGNYIAKQVVDTRPPQSSLIEQSTMFQCFMGVELKLDHLDSTDESEVELMTQMHVDNNTFCFNYVLPYSQDRLLAEVTLFADTPLSPQKLQTKLDQMLENRGWQKQVTLRREYGILPMGLPAIESSSDSLPVQAGMRGGALRPSSGYGFMRIQRWASLCAQQYCNTGQLLPQVTSGFWIQLMDRIFLNVLKMEPQLTPKLFYRLLYKLPPDRFVRFMNDQASFYDCVCVMACLPKTPFLKALFRLVLKP